MDRKSKLSRYQKRLYQLDSREISGAPGEIRTPDPLLRRQMLYPAELRAHPWLLFDSTALAILIRVPTPPKFRTTLEQHKPERRIRCLLFPILPAAASRFSSRNVRTPR